jgi:hypothetical protein
MVFQLCRFHYLLTILRISLPIRSPLRPSAKSFPAFSRPSPYSLFLSLHALEIHLRSTGFLPSKRHRARLDHKSHDLVEDVGGSHLERSDLLVYEVTSQGSNLTYCGKLCVRVVSRGDFDDIRRCQVDALKATNDRADLASRPPTGLRSASGRSECRINCVNVNRQVHGRVLAWGTISATRHTLNIAILALTNTVVDLLDDTSSTNGVDLPGLDNLKSDIAVVLIVGHARKRGPDACMDVRVVLQQALHGSMVEVGAYKAKISSQLSVWNTSPGNALTVVD